MRLTVEVIEEFSTVPGYSRLLVSWTQGKLRRTVASGVFHSGSPPEQIAEELRGLGYRILEKVSPP